VESIFTSALDEGGVWFELTGFDCGNTIPSTQRRHPMHLEASIMALPLAMLMAPTGQTWSLLLL
jgi:hypothetical protein